jgi:BT1 family
MSANSRRAFVTFALFVTTFCQTGQLAKLPIQFILKNELSVRANEMALFLAIILLPWYAKPLFGMVADSIPLRGTAEELPGN